MGRIDNRSGDPRSLGEALGSVVREAAHSRRGVEASMVIVFHVGGRTLAREAPPSGPTGARPRRVTGHQAEGATGGIGLSSTASHPRQDLAPPPPPGSSHPEAASTTRSACRREGGEEKPVAHTPHHQKQLGRERMQKELTGGRSPPFETLSQNGYGGNLGRPHQRRTPM